VPVTPTGRPNEDDAMTPLLMTLGLATQAPAFDHHHPVVMARPVAVSVDEFARCFRPTPGRHEAWVIHPYTHQPVEVCFTLPPGRVRVEAHRNRLEFDCGRHDVDVRFLRNGSVDVRYHD
jgi:hypothetical protein